MLTKDSTVSSSSFTVKELDDPFFAGNQLFSCGKARNGFAINQVLARLVFDV